MPLLTAENVSFAYAAEAVVQRASFSVESSDRIGLVGPNGEGKTTLLKLLTGALEPTGGRVSRQKNLRVGLLAQHAADEACADDRDVRQLLRESFADVDALGKRIEELTERLADDHSPDLLDELGHAQTVFEDRGGYDIDTRIERVLTGLGFPSTLWGQPLNQLSGGQRIRVHLARLLLEAPDLLLLDEPTNHLDLAATEWLEGYLPGCRSAVIVVSHDRYFLDRVVTQTWELAGADLACYRGNYTGHLPKRAARYAERVRLWESQQEYIRKTEEFIARNLAGQRTKEAQGRRTRLERFVRDEAIPRPYVPPTIHLRLPAGKRTGDIVLRCAELQVGYAPGEPIAAVESLEVQRGWRVALLGGNGTGKSTLLRTLLGEQPALSGEVRWGANVQTGYLPQTHAEMDPSATALRAVADDLPCKDSLALDALGMLRLGGETAEQKTAELSGGQRSRIVLARLVARGLAGNAPNVLLLDEPTNHLDIPTTEILQEALLEFACTLLFVSHDRYLIQALATHVWEVGGGRVCCIDGGWEEFLRWRQRQGTPVSSPAETGSGPAGKADRTDHQRSRKQANQIQRLRKQHQKLEADIERFETELETLQERISSASETGRVDEVQQLGRQYQQCREQLDASLAEWERIGEELETQQTT
jgi:ATP-binding cassette, subfamily F, member 3